MANTPTPVVHRSPLIRGVTDDPQNRSKQYIPSAYAVGQLFAGATLNDDIDLDSYLTPGVSHVNKCVNGPKNVGPGYLIVISRNEKETTGVTYRQIYYPDNTTQTAPYTRVKNGTTWSSWTTMGGSWLCATLVKNTIGIPGYMYHSFNNYTLTLPDPSSYPLGTKIGLMQWKGTGKVVWNDDPNKPTEQETTADYDLNKNLEPGTSNWLGALQYIFQVVPDSADEKIWALDVDNNVDGLIVDVLNNTSGDITNLTKLIATEKNERIAGDAALEAKLGNQRSMRYGGITEPAITFINGTGTIDDWPWYNIENTDYTFTIHNNTTITMKRNHIAWPSGAKIILYLHPGVSATVICDVFPSTTEVFQNTSTTDMLVIDMQVMLDGAVNNWTVLEVG